MNFVNRQTEMTSDVINGIIDAYPGIARLESTSHSFALYKTHPQRRVQIITGGGFGKGPQFNGYCIDGLADGVCSGDFHCAPNAYALYALAKKLDQGQGILFLFNNFMGDYLNVDMAMELLRDESIPCQACYATDDIFSAQGEPRANRGGLHGIVLLIKAAAAAAKAGLSLHEVARVVEELNANLRSMAICFNEKAQCLEYGNGFSGESPVQTQHFSDAKQITSDAVSLLTRDLPSLPQKTLYFVLNPMAKTPWIEGMLLFRAMMEQLSNLETSIGGGYAGNYFDIFPTPGCLISILAVDQAYTPYLQHTVHAPGFSI